MRAAASVLALALLAAPAAVAETTSCVACHSDPAFPGPRAVEGVHAELGFSCHDCHGGNPDPALSEDLAAAMDPEFEEHPFVGVPPRDEVPGLCGRCHSDPEFMRGFDPAARVDQEREYWTSRHGLALLYGDARVAICTDCHGVHDILRADDPRSPVYPKRVAGTCAGCHADPKHMAGYTLSDGRPLPVDQYALWRQSVHATALLEKSDLSAPTCNDCHGNHGAAPPYVGVARVCGQCHGREAELFRASPKHEGFESHNEYLADTGGEGCAACHAPPDPAAELAGVTHLGECVACHRNHAVLRPTVALLTPLPETPCAFCHEGASPESSRLLGSETVAQHYREVRDSLLESAQQRDLTGVDRFDWMVDLARELPFHTLPAQEAGGRPALRPEFERLFSKFRIGSTRFEYEDPATGQEKEGRVVRCNDCHAEQPTLADAPHGLQVAGEILERMRELTAVTAAAERTLLRARRGGVATGSAPAEIDAAVHSQVELEVLVHGFESGPDGEFERKQEAGLVHARTALDLADGALDELGSRRRGLAGFLGVVVVALVALGLKIRQISARADGPPGD